MEVRKKMKEAKEEWIDIDKEMTESVSVSANVFHMNCFHSSTVHFAV